MTFCSFRRQHGACNTSNCCNALDQYSIWVKNVIFVFPVLPGSAEAQVIWGGIVKRLLIAYFIGNSSTNNPFMYVKVIPSQRWDVFWDTVYIRLALIAIWTGGHVHNKLTWVCNAQIVRLESFNRKCAQRSLGGRDVAKRRRTILSQKLRRHAWQIRERENL